jgi:hypothetical protein
MKERKPAATAAQACGPRGDDMLARWWGPARCPSAGAAKAWHPTLDSDTVHAKRRCQPVRLPLAEMGCPVGRMHNV